MHRGKGLHLFYGGSCHCGRVLRSVEAGPSDKPVPDSSDRDNEGALRGDPCQTGPKYLDQLLKPVFPNMMVWPHGLLDGVLCQVTIRMLNEIFQQEGGLRNQIAGVIPKLEAA